MKQQSFLFVHKNSPAQFANLVKQLRKDGQQVWFASQTQSKPLPPKTRWIKLPEPNGKDKKSQKQFEVSLHETFSSWRSQGLDPDWIVLHCGWGLGLSLKSVFPRARLLTYMEWWFNYDSQDMNFDPSNPDIHFDAAGRLHQLSRNRSYALECLDADVIVSPTAWQRDQLPSRLRRECLVIHDGCDTQYYAPADQLQAAPSEHVPTLALLPNQETTLLTYATRGMDPYRGFPEWARAMAKLLRKRQDIHVAVAGSDRIVYAPVERSRKYGSEARELFAKAGVEDRVHFLGHLPMEAYRWLLQRSSLHIYFTRPYVLSWSLIEAMACGCAIVASNVEPVREVIRHGKHGLLVDHCDANLAELIMSALEAPGWMHRRQAARRRMENRYDLALTLKAYYGILFETTWP